MTMFMYAIDLFKFVVCRVMRSYSDAHESSSLTLGFSKFEEKKKQQSEKRSKTIKSIMKRGNTSKGNILFLYCVPLINVKT